MARPLPQRALQAIGASPVAERIARAQELLYGRLIGWARRSPLHTDVLGHSLHPPLTDVTLGCWLAASIVDAVGGVDGRRSAALLAAAGFLAATPTALAGTADWADMTGPERRIGAVHALGTDVATFLILGSLVARARGNHRLGCRLALCGNVTAAGAGLLGGHLALSRGTARRTSADDER